MTGTLADALRGGGKFIDWDETGRGIIVSGVVEDVMMRQARKYKSTDLDHWDDGTPKMQAIITIATGASLVVGGELDDGRRSISVNLWTQQKRALAEACRKAGVPEPRPGDTFAAVWTAGAGGNTDPRQFAYQITPGNGLASTLAPTTQPASDPFATVKQPEDREKVAAAVMQAPPTGDPLAGLSPEVIAALAALAKG